MRYTTCVKRGKFSLSDLVSTSSAALGARSGDRGLRQNDWYVVRNARMPAVLAEVGFVSNPEEALHLVDPAYLNDVAQGLYSGVKTFIQGFERSRTGRAQ